jgi:hypothetical protein
MSSLAVLKASFNNDVRINKNYKLWSEALVEDYVNQAYFQVQKDASFSWPENQTSVALTITGAEVTLPADFITVDMVKHGDNTLQKIDKLELIDRNNNAVSGEPTYYYLYGGKIGFDKIPTKTTTLYYKKKLPEMTSLVDSSFSSLFDLMIIKYAAYLAFSTYLPNDQRGVMRLNDYQAQFDSIFGYQFNDNNISFTYSR